MFHNFTNSAGYKKYKAIATNENILKIRKISDIRNN